MAARPLVVFDVNETLLGPGTAEAILRIFGDKSAFVVRHLIVLQR